MTSGTMTNRVDRLAARGLVERLPDPTTAGRAGPADREGRDHRRRRLRGCCCAASATLLTGLDARPERLAGLLRELVAPFSPHRG